MEIAQQLLSGTYVIEADHFQDTRGSFIKTYSQAQWDRLGIEFTMHEEFYSVSHKGVLRGMHFQLPPDDHDKIVYCTAGSVQDVVLDLRKGSNYGTFACIQLSAQNKRILFIPKGIAHGFIALTNGAAMHYKTSSEHSPRNDKGILWNSFGCIWPVDNPEISVKDQNHPTLAEFESPF